MPQKAIGAKEPDISWDSSFPFTVLPFDSDDAVTAGKIRAFLEKQGNIIGPYDYQIAAQGITKGLTVITHNVLEFERIPGIILEDWVV